MEFFLEKTLEKSKARAGLIKTNKGNIHTPIFMPVGTCASVKAVPQNILENEIQAEIILANTYHLFLRPGNEILKNCGGLSSFMNWKKPILTDSGGYQVYSLAKRRKISEEGVRFSSHIDGRECFFTPENVIDTQRIIGSDIIMPLDECTSYPCTYQYAKKSMELTHRWLDRNLSQFKKTENEKNNYQVLFPIVQGSIYKDLRETSAKIISEKDQFGNAIGGVCHPNGMLFEVTNWITDILPENKPRYMMGVGKPKDILECISLGVDMFDCVMPTRNARNGTIFTTKGSINIKNAKYKNDFSPIDDGLEDKFTSNFYTKAYLNHLFKSNEILGSYIASIQNLNFYLFLIKTARKKIIEGDFISWKNKMISIFDQKIE
jgi:queuine tRNA-ribosyltransferase